MTAIAGRRGRGCWCGCGTGEVGDGVASGYAYAENRSIYIRRGCSRRARHRLTTRSSFPGGRMKGIADVIGQNAAVSSTIATTASGRPVDPEE